MRAEDCVGLIGSALTEVASSGRVEIDGESFDAMTVGPPIPAGTAVEVTGWRLVDATRHVLSVRVRRGDEPAPPRQRTAEERLDELERVCAGLRRPVVPSGGSGRLLLTVGQVVSILVCVATPIYAIISLGQTSKLPPSVPDPTVPIVLGAVVVFLYSAAMAVVFNRVKQLPPLD